VQKRITANNNIRAKEVRLIGEQGEQLGVMSKEEAMKRAFACHLDLIQVTDKVEPPICKLIDYGKYAYQQGKKERKFLKPNKAGELKNVRLRFGISDHDLETRAKQAQKFFNQGAKVQLEMVLRGRENALFDFAKKKIDRFIEILKKEGEIIIERPLKRQGKGFTMIFSQKKDKAIYGKNTQGLEKKV